MEGLEAAVIKKSRLNSERRFEAEFFRKKYLVEDSALSKLTARPIGQFAAVTDGPHGYHVVDDESPVAMLTAKNAKDWFADRESAETIAKETHEANLRSSLEDEDIILSTRGTVGLCAIVLQRCFQQTSTKTLLESVGASGRNSCRSTCWHISIRSSVKTTFSDMQRGMVQQGLSLQKVREILIPLLSITFQKHVKTIIRSALECRRRARAEMDHAEERVLEALAIKKWSPPEPLTYTQTAAAVFAASRRDAEFFDPAKIAALKVQR